MSLNTDKSLLKWLIFAVASGAVAVAFVKETRRSKYREAAQLLLEGPLPQSQAPPPADDLGEVGRFERRKQWFVAHCRRWGLLEGAAKVVHVAGTNGKGTVCELVRACAVANGKRVGVFTSPHIHCIRERIRFNDKLISQQDFSRLSMRMAPEFEAQPWMMFFDRLLAVAIAYFAERRAEIIVLEVGIGGRYDSTNFIDMPACVALTSISLDHQSLLGSTIKEIAWQKAGIMKPNRLAITSSQQAPEALEVFKKEALSVQATLDVVENDRYKHVPCSLVGVGQDENLQIAIAVTQHLDLQPVGMDRAFWPCRFEKFNLNGQTVIVDGAHNLDSIQKLFAEIHKRFNSPGIACLFGALRDKNVEDMLSYINSHCFRLGIVKAAHPRSLRPLEIEAMLPKDRGNLRVKYTYETIDLTDAMEHFLKQDFPSYKDCVLVICGSLFVAAEARKCIAGLCPEAMRKNDWAFQE